MSVAFIVTETALLNVPEPQGLLLQAIVALGGCVSIWTSWLCAGDSTLPALSIARDLTVVV